MISALDAVSSVLADEGIYRIDLPMRSVSPNVRQVNAWLLARPDGSGDLYDTGTAEARASAGLERALEKAGVRKLDRLVVSHGHPDHVGQALSLRAVHGSELLVPEGLHSPCQEDEIVIRAFLRLAGAPVFDASEAAPWQATSARTVAGGTTLRLGRRLWRAEIQGGHAPASLLLFSDCGRFVFSADQLLPGIGTFVGVSPGRPLDNCLGRQIGHLERLMQVPPDMIALPGHGAPFAGIPKVAAAQIASYRRRLARLLAALERPGTCAQLTGTMFRPPISDIGRMVQLRMAMAFCNFLVEEGALQAGENREGARIFFRAG
ncbi:MAG: MBL fold metallo-hydrolase [Martelella sp.]|uniref:MBL fold metallo-hydrolase n=1 Tax=Martelella sp. TaxID=1969699 RepID=UPI003242AED9